MPETSANFNHNQPIYTVSEVSHSLKRVVEDHFGTVRIRGEISGFKLHSSGHAYFCLKDEQAVLDAVCWRGNANRLNFKPEDGLEVIGTGKITTYPGRSKYQIVIDRMEPAGIGALMALLEKRRKQLEAEGLFAPERKKPLPFLPRSVGVVTSPTGAVIRDILHRIADRFPVQVLVWPVAVQGEGAAEQVAAAIQGFNALQGELRPEVLIVARGGGSIEDLWAFNEEIVVRAASASIIPLISAVGHETDTTLIDYVSDRRAPTPTAAAEMAVPVREELWMGCKQLDARLSTALMRLLSQRQEAVGGLARGLPRPMQLLQTASQRLDDWSERLLVALPALLSQRQEQLVGLTRGLPRPIHLLQAAQERLDGWMARLEAALPVLLSRKEQQLHVILSGLRPQLLLADLSQTQRQLDEWQERMRQAMARRLDAKEETLRHQAVLLESVNYQRILERGFALVKNRQGHVVTSAQEAARQSRLSILFKDGDVEVEPV